MSAIHWFRKGLRLHDNPALLEAISSQLVLRPVFILDPEFIKSTKVGPNRWRFLFQSLQDLDSSLRSLGSRLFVLRGEPKEVLTSLLDTWDVKMMTWEEDTEPYAVARDEGIKKMVTARGVSVETFCSHTLYRPEEIAEKNNGKAPLTLVKFQSVIATLKAPSKPLDAPESLAKESRLSEKELKDPQNGVPLLTEVNVIETELHENKFPGGETEGLKRFNEKLSKENATWVRNFEKPQTSPNSLSPSTTVLSPYLKFGCVSPRLMYWRLSHLYSGAKHSQPPVSLHGQLLWREFYYSVAALTPNFDKMAGNTVCRQVPWDQDEEKLAAWTEARTGFPFIDAIMTQLRTEGWIHHLARHAVACFLTRGDLWQSWEKGQEVFEELLLDADWSLNAGNWMWLSASAFFHQYWRVYSPVAFGKKTDKSGEYIRKYLPILKKMPEKYIYQPWEAPLQVQKAAGCVIGKDYPRPMVDHAVVSKENMARMKAACEGSKAAAKTKKVDSYFQKGAKKRKVDE